MTYQRYNYDILISGNEGDSWALQVYEANFMLSKYYGTIDSTGYEKVSLVFYASNGVFPMGTIEFVENGEHCHSLYVDEVPNSKDDFLDPSFIFNRITCDEYDKELNYYVFLDNENISVILSLNLPKVLDWDKITPPTSFLDYIYDSSKYKEADFKIDDIEYDYDDSLISVIFVDSGKTDYSFSTNYKIKFNVSKANENAEFDDTTLIFQYLGMIINVDLSTNIIPMVSKLIVVPKNVIMRYPATSCTLHVVSVYENDNIDYEVKISNPECEDYFFVSGNTVAYNLGLDSSISFSNAITVTNGKETSAINLTYIMEEPSLDSLQIYLSVGTSEFKINSYHDLTTSFPIIQFSSNENCFLSEEEAEKKTEESIKSGDKTVYYENYYYSSDDNTYYVNFTETLEFHIVYTGLGVWEASLNNNAKQFLDLSSDNADSECRIQLNSTEQDYDNNRLYIKTLEEDWHCVFYVEDDLNDMNYTFNCYSGSSTLLYSGNTEIDNDNAPIIPSSQTTSDITNYPSVKIQSSSVGKSHNNSKILQVSFTIPVTVDAVYGNGESSSWDDADKPKLNIKAWKYSQNGWEEVESINDDNTDVNVYIVCEDLDKNKVNTKEYGYYLEINDDEINKLNINGMYTFRCILDQNASNYKIPIKIQYYMNNANVYWLINNRTIVFYKDGNTTNGFNEIAYCIKDSVQTNYCVKLSTDIIENDELVKPLPEAAKSYILNHFYTKDSSAKKQKFINENIFFSSGFTMYADAMSYTENLEFNLELWEGTESSANQDKITVHQYMSASDEAVLGIKYITEITDVSLGFNGEYLTKDMTNLSSLYCKISFKYISENGKEGSNSLKSACTAITEHYLWSYLTKEYASENAEFILTTDPKLKYRFDEGEEFSAFTSTTANENIKYEDYTSLDGRKVYFLFQFDTNKRINLGSTYECTQKCDLEDFSSSLSLTHKGSLVTFYNSYTGTSFNCGGDDMRTSIDTLGNLNGTSKAYNNITYHFSLSSKYWDYKMKVYSDNPGTSPWAITREDSATVELKTITGDCSYNMLSAYTNTDYNLHQAEKASAEDFITDSYKFVCRKLDSIQINFMGNNTTIAVAIQDCNYAYSQDIGYYIINLSNMGNLNWEAQEGEITKNDDGYQYLSARGAYFKLPKSFTITHTGKFQAL